MFHHLTPDLPDPLLLAETTVASLYEAVGLERGEIKVTYDTSLSRNPLRIKSSDDAVYDTQAGKRRIGELIEQLDDALPPFRVAFMKAGVRRPVVQPWPLDLMTAVSGLQLFYLRAQACNELLGETLQVVASISLPRSGDGKVRAQVDVYLIGEGKAPPEQTAALREYCVTVQVFWNRLASTVVGHWAKDNGITELRFAADIHVDPRQAMAAIGQPVEETIPNTVH